MNFLAHTFLSGNSDNIRIGNFIGDFVRGKQIEQFPAPIIKGIRLHRKIDQYTDQHPLARQSAARLKADFGRYAPVLVDIFYDHFLARNFQNFSPIELSRHAQETYKILEKSQVLLPARVQEFLPSMIANNWLLRYGDLDGIHRSLQGINRRAKFGNDLDQAILNLKSDYQDFENDFLEFFPDIIHFVQEELAN